MLNEIVSFKYFSTRFKLFTKNAILQQAEKKCICLQIHSPMAINYD